MATLERQVELRGQTAAGDQQGVAGAGGPGGRGAQQAKEAGEIRGGCGRVSGMRSNGCERRPRVRRGRRALRAENRVCLCDTVGTAIPEGVADLVSWARSLLDKVGDDIGIDWHGHRDRGLALGNSLAAVKGGATRVHGTAPLSGLVDSVLGPDELMVQPVE